MENVKSPNYQQVVTLNYITKAETFPIVFEEVISKEPYSKSEENIVISNKFIKFIIKIG